MTIRVFNTLTGCKEPLVPLEPGRVGMYVCGPTVYDAPHLGHARSAVVFDVINRYLEAMGHVVTYVRNITDIDDKLIDKARSCGRDFQSLGTEYADCYRAAMQRLNVRVPDREPRATDYIGPIQSCIAGLVEKGHAYRVGSGVYFAIKSCKRYGRLSGGPLTSASMAVDHVSDKDKKHPSDFVLWKAARAKDPAWPSPWGPGRPGWHIECTAMGAALLGEQFDIHGGGADLIFPHHENEIAQSESLFGKAPARYWLHHGLVQIRGEKMAKSRGNGLRLNDLLDEYGPGALRLFLLSRRYRHPIDYSRRALQTAVKHGRRIERFISGMVPAIYAPEKVALDESSHWLRFCNAMNDDFNFPMGLAVVFEGIRTVHRKAGSGFGERIFKMTNAVRRTVAALAYICSEILGFDTPIRSRDPGAIEIKTAPRQLRPAPEPVNIE